MDKPEFVEHAAKLGYGEPAMREYEPNLIGNLHTHDFSAILLVIRGAFSLALENDLVKLEPGDVYEVPAGTLHDERAGPDGAAILLAKK